MSGNEKPGNKPLQPQLQVLKGVGVSLICLAIAQGIAYAFSTKNSYRLHYMAGFIILIQWVGFAFSSGLLLGNEPTEKYYDLIGSVTYLLTLGFGFSSIPRSSVRQKLVTFFASIWSIRLGYFLFSRISRNAGVDSRFTKIKTSLPDFLIAWSVQGLWVFLTLLSVLLIDQIDDTEEMTIINYVGILLWITGFLIESVADHEKSVFKNNSANKGKWISTGLWSVSRHPNYFGEICLWCGVSLCCYSKAFHGAKLLISPLFVAFLLIFISGIPILERKADSLYGDNKEYLKYKNSTPVLFPMIGRAGEAKF